MSVTVTVTIDETPGDLTTTLGGRTGHTKIQITRATKVEAIAAAIGMVGAAHRAEIQRVWDEVRKAVEPLLQAAAESAPAAPATPEPPRTHSGVAGFQAEAAAMPVYADDCPATLRSPG